MTDTKLVKSAGEHWVCSALSLQGWGVALTRDGLEHTDILAVQANEPTDRRMIEVQVKAASYAPNPNWMIGAKAQELEIDSGREWFVLVVLAETPQRVPQAFIVPRDHVAAAAWITWHNWRFDPTIEPGKRNTPREQSRLHPAELQGYENRWGLLTKPTTTAPILLPPELRTAIPPFGLPEHHPWTTRMPKWAM